MKSAIQNSKTVEIRNSRTAKVTANNAVGIEGSKAVGTELKKAVSGLHLVHVSRIVRQSQLREGTTGRPIAVPHIVPRVMAVADSKPAPVAEEKPVPPQPKVELAFYRKYTEAMLRRYIRVSMQPGRTPSLLGRELFPGDASHSTMTTFEDGIVFCIDIERCLAKLRKSDQSLLNRIAIQGYTHEEAAPLLGLSFKWCVIHYGRALDRFTELLLASCLINPQNCCQDPEMVEN